jgi:flagellar basal-body rod modification protein FlgD
MDPISPTQSGSNVTAHPDVQAAVGALGSDVFLRLLVTQLQSQDPTNPVQNEDFVAQLAQFTTLEQATMTNKLLERMMSQDTQRTQLDLVNLIGRTVVTEGNTVSLGETDSPALGYAVSETANRVTIQVLGPNGEVLRTLSSTGPEGPGAHQIQWDGLNESGDRLPEGVYQFRVKAEDAGEHPVPTLTFARERVMNIVLGTEKPVVVQSGKTLPTEDIISIQ